MQNAILDNRGGYISPKIIVIGDAILDRYIFGRCERISPEAPVPIMTESSSEDRGGGAVNVALNLKAFGCDVTLFGITGDDKDAKILEKLCNSINWVHFQKIKGISTTLKTRYVCDGQQVLRMDRENVSVNTDILKYFETQLPHCDYVVIPDYGKHFSELIPKIITLSRRHEKHVIVDPKSSDWSRYVNSSTITPNIREFREAGGVEAVGFEPSGIDVSCHILRNKFNIDDIHVTKGALGLSLSTPTEFYEDSTVSSEVVDVTGAGDTVVAAYVTALAFGFTAEERLEFANEAAGEVCRKLGTSVVDGDLWKDTASNVAIM